MRSLTLLAAVLLVLMVWTQPAASAQAQGGFEFVGRAGSLAIYKSREACVYYVTLDPSAFDYVYAGRFLVKRIHNFTEYLAYLGNSFWAFFPNNTDANLTPVLQFEWDGSWNPDDLVNRILARFFETGVAHYFVGRPALWRIGSRSGYVEVLNLTVLDVRVKGSIPPGFLQALGELRSAAEKLVNTSIDCIIIEEALDRRLWMKGDDIASLINASMMESMGINSIGGNRLIPLIIEFNTKWMEGHGVSELDALKWLDSVIPKDYGPVVVLFTEPYIEPKLLTPPEGNGPDPSATTEARQHLWLAITMALVVAGLAFAAARKSFLRP